MWGRQTAGLCAIAIAACVQAPQKAMESTIPFDPALAAQIDAAVTAHFPEANALGASVAVTRADGSVHTFTIGIASTETEHPVAPADTFRIASITKTFMASIVLQLVDEGVLSLEDPVDKWVPGFNLGEQITLRRVMNHTSGVYNFTDDERFLFLSVEDWTPRQIVQWALDHGPVFAPGAGYNYSNTNYYLVGLTIEAATGKKVEDVLQERILGPQKLTQVWWETADHGPDSVGFLHKSAGPPFSVSWEWAAGGMDASAQALCRWGRALYIDRTVIPSALVDEMIAEATLTDGRKVTYGLAADINTRGGHQVVGHTGLAMGFRDEMFFDLATGDCVVVQTNDFFADQTALSVPIWQLLPKATP